MIEVYSYGSLLGDEQARAVRLRVRGPGHHTLGEIAARLAEEGVRAEGVETITVSDATFGWVRPENDQEREHRLAREEQRKERTERWEKETYERLKAKFEGEQG